MNGEEKEEIFYLPEMFPKRVVLFSTKPLERSQAIPYKMAYSYLKAAEGTDKKLIWITTEQAAEKVPEVFEEFGFGIEKYKDKIIFVDLVSKSAGIKIKQSPGLGYKTVYIENPNNLIDVSMVFSDLFSDTLCQLAIIDSVNGFLAFNSEQNVVRFLRFLPSIAYRTDTTLLLILLKGEYSEDIESAIQTCADASMVADNNFISIKTRFGNEKIPLSL